ncbi:CatB-related O-acetyltransferase [Larkinella punicea]|uniref:Antibiotic acetyltransferase n=1 Tax=Larkinella punicea TaxID=2315727 RepID=A0A368JLS8_9BACT|nr:CatB-related O-acetyltransferase [Larkinella punicea]RCR67624.1 antibiotic acetyltransferase [Larkinella punicea]
MLKNRFINLLRFLFQPILVLILSKPTTRLGKSNIYYLSHSYLSDCIEGKFVKKYFPYSISNVKIGDYTYISQNSCISNAIIGKFCSIGPNFLCGWGIHPVNGISTSPMFYSTKKQNGTTFSLSDKITERENIVIGNDVFIGANVTILDGINIGDGVIIAAGSVVTEDLPSFVIAGGVPAKIIKNRFSPAVINSLIKIRWWEFHEDSLKDVEKYFWNVEDFIRKYDV